MIILGIDPGSRQAGYGVIEMASKSFKYVDSGVLSYQANHDFFYRLGEIYDSCAELTKRFRPHEIALEALIHVKSVPALAKLAQARGAMVAAFASTHQGRIFEYSGSAVKKAVTGSGSADKKAVERILHLMFKEQLNIKRHDQSDALAIAICHALLRSSTITKHQYKEATL